jgi:hypothetical protein
MLLPGLRNLWLFSLRILVSGFGVVAFQYLLDALDGAVQLTDQVFIGGGEQVGKKLANVGSDLSIFLATTPHFKLILPIYHVTNGDARPHEQSTETLQQPVGGVAKMGDQEVYIQAHEPSARSPQSGCG